MELLPSARLVKAPIRGAQLLGNSQAAAQTVFSSKDCSNFGTKAQGGTKHLQRKRYSQPTTLDLNSNEFKSISL